MSFRAEKIFNTAVTAQEIPLGFFFAFQGRKKFAFYEIKRRYAERRENNQAKSKEYSSSNFVKIM